MAPEPSVAAAYIRQKLRLTPVEGLPEISLYAPHAGSGLTRFLGDDAEPPYWAWPWAGGLVLAHLLVERPVLVAGRRVLDLGAGSGLLGIVARRLGAEQVLAAEADPMGRVAIALNAEANATRLEVVDLDLSAPLPPVDVILAGDVFYDPALASRMLPCLERALAAGSDVLIGDPFRQPLPLDRLEAIYHRRVRDFGSGQNEVDAAVFRLRTAP